MKREEIRNLIRKRLEETRREVIDRLELEIEEKIDEDVIEQYLWDIDYGKNDILEKFDIDDRIENYISEIYEEEIEKIELY